MTVAAATGYQAIVADLGENTARVIGQLAEKLTAGTIDLDTFLDVAAPLLGKANAQGHYLAEQRLAAILANDLGGTPAEWVAGLDIDPAIVDVNRLRQALDTAVAEPDSAVMRATRLATSAPVRAAAESMGRAMRESSAVTGYTRGLEPDHCELCGWLWKDGYIYPPTQPMHQHPGCLCVQNPVTDGKTRHRPRARNR